MFSKTNDRRCSVFLALLLLLISSGVAFAQSTSFTYQGRLTDGGTPANGNYDLQFALFDSAAGGTQVGATQTVNTVAVSDGIFTVQLDFGASAFPGESRFLEISARLSGSGSFAVMSPRQPITSTPYAVRSLNASSADSIPANALPAGSVYYIQNATTQQTGASFNVGGGGTIGGNLIANGNVGIGTSTLTDKLTVKTATSNYGFIHTDGTVNVGSFVGGSNGGGWYGTRSNHPLSFFTNNQGASLTINTAGKVRFDTGIDNISGGGFKHKRESGSLPPNSITDFEVIWGIPFADANYTLSVTLDVSQGRCVLKNVRNKTAGSVSVVVDNQGPASEPCSYTVNLIGIHD